MRGVRIRVLFWQPRSPKPRSSAMITTKLGRVLPTGAVSTSLQLSNAAAVLPAAIAWADCDRNCRLLSDESNRTTGFLGGHSKVTPGGRITHPPHPSPNSYTSHATTQVISAYRF